MVPALEKLRFTEAATPLGRGEGGGLSHQGVGKSGGQASLRVAQAGEMSPVRGDQPGIPQHRRTSDKWGLVAARGLTSQGPQSYLPEGLAVSICHTDLPHSTQGLEVLW